MRRFRRQSVAAIAAGGVVIACLGLYQWGVLRHRAAAQLLPVDDAHTESSLRKARLPHLTLTQECDRLERITRRRAQNPVVLSDEEADEIKLLISGLSELADTSHSMHFDMYIREFRPLANDGLFHPSRNNGRLYSSTAVLKSEFEPCQRLDQSPAINRLVELGPRALPLLLLALDDATPTRIEVIRRGFCNTILDGHIWVNPRNPFEWADSERWRASPNTKIEKHTVKAAADCESAVTTAIGRV